MAKYSTDRPSSLLARMAGNIAAGFVDERLLPASNGYDLKDAQRARTQRCKEIAQASVTIATAILKEIRTTEVDHG
ncbi:MAG: hypothetical protein EPN91_00500 [Salinibacterium sp.]|nr:MAG: hypothetical protein EPN91_00500 [Salinibacterium sp.]